MVTYVTSLKNAPKQLRLKAKADIAAVIRAARRTTQVDCMRIIQQVIMEVPKKQRPFDTGDYKRSWKSEDTDDGAIFYSAATPAVKAGVIEHGRRPGKGIPQKPLLAWVQRKLRIKDVAKAKHVAAIISINAKRFGRPGLGIMKKAHPRMVAAFQANLEKELKRR
jgi:hypothetical protein